MMRTPAAPHDVPTWRLHLVRAMYALVIVGLATVVWPQFFGKTPHMFGIHDRLGHKRLSVIPPIGGLSSLCFYCTSVSTRGRTFSFAMPLSGFESANPRYLASL